MNKDIYNTFEDYKFDYAEPELDEYTFDKDTPEYEWDYGDTVNIPFRIDPMFWGHEIHINIYNFRFELIASDIQQVDGCGQVYLVIDSETSEEVFKQGIYYCQLQAVQFTVLDESTGVEDCQPVLPKTVCTLIPATMCSIYVR